jgi:hypothetical protein
MLRIGVLRSHIDYRPVGGFRRIDVRSHFRSHVFESR